MSNETKHTPGPWKAKRYGHQDWKVVSSDYGTVVHRSCYPDPKVDTTTEADAKLIAASPGMLEALRILLDECEHEWGDTRGMLLARAAIKHAVEG